MNKFIVSFTSYPARIKRIQTVLDSIMAQTCKPDKVVLYLSDEQFVDRFLPVDLSSYFECGLEIHWCKEDMKSHKKYLYAFQEYSDDYILTIDDDHYYEKHMVEEFLQYVGKFPGCVLARGTHLITVRNDGKISSYEKWWRTCMHYIGIPRMDLFAVGGAGILYPPRLFIDEVLNTDSIKEYCIYADDIWLKVMELLSAIPVVQVPTRFLDTIEDEFAKDGLYQRYNGNGGNDRSLYQLLEKYGNSGGMKESITERIFSTGVVCEEEIAEERKKDNIRLVKEYMDSIERNVEIVIYGAGIVAKRIYSVLKQDGKTDRIRAFAVNDISKNVPEIEGIPVVQYENVNYGNAVCIIAVSNVKDQYEICRKLLSIGLRENQIRFLNYAIQNGLKENV